MNKSYNVKLYEIGILPAVPSVLAQVVAQGNIIIGDEVEMTSKQKTFAVALSREMVPTARIVVYFIRQPEEIVTDVLNFFVNGTRQNEVWWMHVSVCSFYLYIPFMIIIKRRSKDVFVFLTAALSSEIKLLKKVWVVYLSGQWMKIATF